MGRSTHNKNTQRVYHSQPEIKVKTSNTVLTSLKEIKQHTDQPTIISHSNTDSISESAENAYKTINEFSVLSQKVSKWYDDNELKIKNHDQLAIDMLHEIELSPPKDLWRAYKCYSKLRQSRQERRKAKVENRMLLPIYNYLKDNPTLCKDMKNLCERCAGVQYDVEHSTYYFKSDLKID